MSENPDALQPLRETDDGTFEPVDEAIPIGNGVRVREDGTLVSESVDTEEGLIGTDNRQIGTPVDLFVVGGQSNALGSPNNGPGPAVKSKETGIEYDYSNDSLVKLPNGSFGSDAEGHAWTAFAIRYKQLTGRPVCMVEAASDGSAMTSGADTGGGNWYSDTSLPATMTDRVNKAWDRLKAAGYDPQFHGVLFCQGERDAIAIDNANTTKQAYKDEFINDGSAQGDSLITRLDTDGKEPWESHDWGFYILETGYPDGGDTTGYRKIRRAQREIVDQHDLVHMASGVQLSFPQRGLMVSTENHYEQTGLNEMGRRAAERIVGGQLDPRSDAVGYVTSADRNGTNQTHSSGTSQERIAFDNAPDNAWGLWDTGNNFYFAEWDGEYRITVKYAWNSASSGMRSRVNINGSSNALLARGWAGAAAAKIHDVEVTKTISAAPGEPIKATAKKDDTTNYDIRGLPEETYIDIEYKGKREV